jgi:thiamine pyrophosphokinase
MPDFVIGDMDSARKRDLAEMPVERIIRVTEQDTTDFEKCLMAISAPLILGVGFLGGRLDHELAALSALVRYVSQPCILLSRTEICFHPPRKLTLTVEPGSRVSLFPLAQVRGKSTGLRWPIDTIAFAPDGRIGTSNIAERAQITLEMDRPGMLVILPRRALPQVIEALSP